MSKTARFPYNGITHLTLLYLQMKKKPVLKKDIYAFYSHKFRDNQAINRVITGLTSHNFITETPDGYAITDWGSHHLHFIAKKYKGKGC